MSARLWTELTDRGVVAVKGPDATAFLQGLLSAEIEALEPGRVTLAALLSPQGKILFDGLVVRTENGFLIDCRRSVAADFAKRLGFYKLRAKVEVRDLTEDMAVVAVWAGEGVPAEGFEDPRSDALGHRLILPRGKLASTAQSLGAQDVELAAYHAHRIVQGVPEGGLDYAYGDTFPHEANMDRMGGVSFTKGCYVGQEVVSRMQHRGTARTRTVKIILDDFSPEPGQPILAGDKQVGSMGSTAGKHGLALIRTDRVSDALAAGIPLTAGGLPIRIAEPDELRPPPKQTVA